MFIYLFPIFCFGLVMTGIVFLGILEASKQAKSDSLIERESETLGHSPKTMSPRNGQSNGPSPRFAPIVVNE